MNTEDVLDEFRGAGALREGHFILASGRHSPMFLQKNLVFQYPERTARLCKALAEKIVAQFGKPDVIISPAVGAIIPGYETARWLDVPAMYVEREDGAFKLRRAFKIEPGAKVVVIEDVITTGGQVVLSTEDLRGLGAIVEHVVCVIDRSPDGGAALAERGLTMHALITKAELDEAEARRT